MRIAVAAAGAVGGYFGGRLAAAGHEVAFLARGENLRALRERGLRLHSTLGDLHLPSVNATDDPAAVGPVDVVLFAVKLWDTEIAAEAIRPLLGPFTRAITLQNGVDSVERLAPILGPEHVIGAVAYIASVLEAPGVVRHTSEFAIDALRARRPLRPIPALAAFVEAGQGAGIDIALASADIVAERWKKFTFLVAVSALTAATREPLGPVLANSETRAFFGEVMREVMAVARRRAGSRCRKGSSKSACALPMRRHVTMRASMAHDLARGNRLELDWLSGKVASAGPRALGVPTPANAAVDGAACVAKEWCALRPRNAPAAH